MANQLINPLDLAAQLQLPIPGTLAAPGGDSPGANPFEFQMHVPQPDGTMLSTHVPAPGPGAVVPPPVPPPVATDTLPTPPVAAQDTGTVQQEADTLIKPVDPMTAMPWVKTAAQGTATAPASDSGWSGAPVVPPPQVSGPGEMVVHLPHVPLLAKPDPAEAPFDALATAKAAYGVAKAAVTGMVDDVANWSEQAFWNGMYRRDNEGNLVRQVPTNLTVQDIQAGNKPQFRSTTPQEDESAQRGAGLLATMAIPEAKLGVALDAVPPQIKAKVLTWVALHALNGAAGGLAYGAITAKSPTAEDMSKSMTDNALAFAWQAPLLGAVFKGFGVTIGKGLNATGIGPKLAAVLGHAEVTPAVLKQAQLDAFNLMYQMHLEGGDPKMLPDQMKDEVLANIITDAQKKAPAKKPFVKPSITPDQAMPAPGDNITGLQAPRKFTDRVKGEVTGLTPPREVSNLPDPGHEHQERIATGVYRNPDGTIQAYGYRGSSGMEPNLGADGGLKPREPTTPGQMGVISISPHDGFAQGFGDLHFMEANFDNPLVIDNWHDNLGLKIEKQAQHFDENVVTQGQFEHQRTFEGKTVAYLGERQPGVIWAARQLGHDGIVVRHGNESVEIVALHPSKVHTSGAADYAASPNAKSTLDPSVHKINARTPEQQTIVDRASTTQNGVRDLGQSSFDVTPGAKNLLYPTQIANVRNLIEQHMKIQAAPSLYDVRQTLKPGEDLHQAFDLQKMKQREGLWKVNGRVFKAEVVDVPNDLYGQNNQYPSNANTYPHMFKDPTSKSLEITDVTGQTGVDPTINPETAQSALVYDGIAKGMSVPDLAQQLELDHQVITQKLLNFEPNPIEHGRITVYDRNVRTLMSAMDAIEAGNMDDALHQLTQPREIEFPEESATKVERRASKLELDKPGEMAPDGRILTESVDEHLRNAQQLKSFGMLDEAAQRVKWAFDKDPIEAEKLIREDPAKYAMPNPAHLEANKKLITADEQQLLDIYRQQIAENRAPFQRAMRTSDRPESVRIQKIIQNARDGTQRILAEVRDRNYPPLPELKSPGINEVRPFTFESYKEGQHLLPDIKKMIEYKATLGKREIPFQVGHVSVPPILEERPPWAPLAEGTAVPQIPDDWALLHRMHAEDVKDIVNNSKIPGQKSLREGFIQNGGKREPMGAVHAQTLFRLAAGGSSGLMYAAAYRTDDPRTRRYMRTAAGVLAVLAVLPQKDGWLAKRVSEGARKSMDVIMLQLYDLPAYLHATVGSEAAETVRTAADLGNDYNVKNMLRTREIKKVFPTAQLRETALRALDDPDSEIHWGQLSQEQRHFLAGEGIFNMHQRDLLEKAGVVREFQEDLLKHVFPRKTYQAWESARNNPNPTASSYTRPPLNPRIADLEAWAKLNKLPAPIMDLAYVQSRHMGEVGRTLMKAQLTAEMKRIGLLIPTTDELPDGFSVVRANGLNKMMAPKGVALAIERMDKPNGDGNLTSGVLRGLDDFRSWGLRTIMAWPLVHSKNMMLSALSMGVKGVTGTIENLNAMQLGDPSTMRAAKYGLDLSGSRTDYSADHQNAIEAMFNGLSDRTGGLGKIVLKPVGNFFGMMERGLWDHLVPAVGLTGFNIEMQKWVAATGGKFVEGSPEFTAAAHRASAFGNTMMGKSPSILRSPGLEYAMRQAFFAPGWFETRLKINLTALGEARGLMTGKMKLSDVQYLPVKMRSIMIGSAITYGLSKLLTGKPPQFNPQSEKYYAHTGIHDRNGRELGLDLIGFWSDDIKMFGDPTMYFMNRISPQIQLLHTLLTGRDVFGRVITDENLMDTAIGSLGPISTVTNLAARAFNSSGNMTRADKLKSAMEVSQLGSVSALPHINELMAQKMAHRLLRLNGLPADDPDKVYELQQMIIAAQKSSKNPFSKQMVTWLAKQKMAERSQTPRIPAAQHGWQRVMSVLRNLGKSSAPTPAGIVTEPPAQGTQMLPPQSTSDSAAGAASVTSDY